MRKISACRFIAATSLATGALLWTATANAGVLFSENFSGAVPGGGSSAGGAYSAGPIPGTGFADLAPFNVDILGVLNGTNFSCVDNPAGNCLDLVGNQGGGAITSIPTFNLVAGDTYTVTFGADLQGFSNQSASTTFSVGLGALSQVETLVSDLNTRYSLTFTPVSNQTGANLSFTTISAPDGVHGAVIDNITLASASAGVPEPASWAMMMLGFGVVGYALRKRQGVHAAVALA